MYFIKNTSLLMAAPCKGRAASEKQAPGFCASALLHGSIKNPALTHSARQNRVCGITPDRHANSRLGDGASYRACSARLSFQFRQMVAGKIQAGVKLQRGAQIFAGLLGIAHEFFAQAEVGEVHC